MRTEGKKLPIIEHVALSSFAGNKGYWVLSRRLIARRTPVVLDLGGVVASSLLHRERLPLHQNEFPRIAATFRPMRVRCRVGFGFSLWASTSSAHRPDSLLLVLKTLRLCNLRRGGTLWCLGAGAPCLPNPAAVEYGIKIEMIL